MKRSAESEPRVAGVPDEPTEQAAMPPGAGGDARPKRALTARRWTWLTLRASLSSQQSGLVAALVIFSVAIWLKNPQYFGEQNLIEILRSTVYIFIIGIFSTYVFVAGGLDLSVGSVYALGAIVSAEAMVHHIPVVPAILIGLGSGAVVGAMNGVITQFFGIPPLITTLGSLYVFEGIVVIMTGGNPVYPLPASFNAIGQDSIGPIPYLVVYAAVLGVLGYVLLEHTTFGYRIRATGGNQVAARAMGIGVKRLSIVVYVLSGVSAALAGVLFTSQLGSGQPSIGTTTELQVIAAVIIGGTSLFGGIGTIPGTLLGSLLLSVITDGLVLVNFNPAYQNVATGIVIVLAVGIDKLRRGRQWRLTATANADPADEDFLEEAT